MANFILVHQDESQDLHTLYWNVPFTAEEICKILDFKGKKHGEIEELDFEPYDIPKNVRLAWILPLGVKQYQELLKALR